MSGDGDFVMPTAEVRELGNKLRFVAAEFEDSEDLASDYAGEVGNYRLADEVREFAENWHHKRRALMDTLKDFAEAAKKCADEVDGVEDDLVAALYGGES